VPRAIAAAIAAVVLASPSLAWAGSAIGLSAIIDNCQNSKLDPDTRISACSQLIRTNLLDHAFLGAFYTIRGEAYFAKADYDDALKDYDKAFELNPDFPQTSNNRGFLYQHLGKLDLAVQDFDRAGFLDLGSGKCANAIKNYSYALADDPKNAQALYGRGLCKARNGDAPGAQADAAAALALDPHIDSEMAWPK